MERDARARRLAHLQYDYRQHATVVVPTCNLCGPGPKRLVAQRDRYGYRIDAWQCDRCGLLWLSPILPPQARREFYASWYRPLVSAWHGRTLNARTIQLGQLQYARRLWKWLAPHLTRWMGTTLLDVGGSTGIVSDYVAQRLARPIQTVLVDPNPRELAEARHLRGARCRVVETLFEDYQPEARFDLVLMCQTLDHVADLTGTLRHVRTLVAPGGLFVVDYVNLAMTGGVAALKIDHPYGLTLAPMVRALKQTGWACRSSTDLDPIHPAFLCQPAPAVANA